MKKSISKYIDWYEDYKGKVKTSVWDMIEYGMIGTAELTKVYKNGQVGVDALVSSWMCPERLMYSTLEIWAVLSYEKVKMTDNRLYEKQRHRELVKKLLDDLHESAKRNDDSKDASKLSNEKIVPYKSEIDELFKSSYYPRRMHNMALDVLGSEQVPEDDKREYLRLCGQYVKLSEEINDLEGKTEKGNMSAAKRNDVLSLIGIKRNDLMPIKPGYEHSDDFKELKNRDIQRLLKVLKASMRADPAFKLSTNKLSEKEYTADWQDALVLRIRERVSYLDRSEFIERMSDLFRNGNKSGYGRIGIKQVMNLCCDYLEEEVRNSAYDEDYATVKMSGLPLAELAETYRNLYDMITKKVVSQDVAVSKFLKGIFDGEMVEIDKRMGPAASFLFMGPPGVGKTYLATVASELLKRPCKMYFMSEYAHESSFHGLVGFERTWRDSQTGDLTEYVMDNPDAILIFDEIEKAHPRTVRLFLSMLEGGTMRDLHYERDVDFRRTIVIFTTNAGRKFYEKNSNMRISSLPMQVLVDALNNDIDTVTKSQVMPPELISRLAKGNIIGFDHMTPIKLLPIIRSGIEEGVAEAEKSLNIKCSYDKEKLPHLLLFKYGTMLDARVASGKSRDFIKEIIYSLMEKMGADAKKYRREGVGRIQIKADRNDVTEELLHLYKGEKGKCFLIFSYANNKKYTDCFENVLNGKLLRYHTIIYDGSADIENIGSDDIRSILRHNLVDAILVDPLWWKLPNGAGKEDVGVAEGIIHQQTKGNEALRWLLAQDDIPPVYALSFGRGFDVSDRIELREEGVRDVLKLDLSDPSSSMKCLDDLAYELFLNENLDHLVSRGRSLDFNVRYKFTAKKSSAKGKNAKAGKDIPDDILIQLYDFKKIRSFSTEADNVIIPDLGRKGGGFDDVIGAKDAVEALKHFIYYIKDQKGFIKSGQSVSKGILLYGPPGTGKTMLARALSTEADCPYIAVSGSELMSGQKKVSDIFNLARKYGPSILFIDEIDALGMSRGYSNGVSNSVLNELLIQMDGFSKDREHPVFVIAATNAAEKPGIGGHRLYIDRALQRRFTKLIYVDLPDKDERIKYLKMRIDKLRDGEYNFNSLTEEDIEQFALHTAGYSIGDIENVIDNTISVAVDERMTSISLELLIRCFEEAMFGEKLKVDVGYIRSVAIHEIGHAYLSFMGGEKFIPQYATIVARANYLGKVEHVHDEVARGLTKADIISRIRISLAGRAAEQVCLGEQEGLEAGADNDLIQATHYAALLVGAFGMEEGFLPVITLRSDIHPFEQMMNSPLADKYYEKINTILNREMETTKEIIRKNQKNIEKAADELVDKSRLGTEELRKLLKVKLK